MLATKQLYLYQAEPYIDLHDTKKIDENIESTGCP